MRAEEFIIIPVKVNVVEPNTAAAIPQTTTPQEPVDDNVGKFIPPLQQKIELLKKSTGVKSEFDGDSATVNKNTNTNVNTTAIQIASDDEPLDM